MGRPPERHLKTAPPPAPEGDEVPGATLLYPDWLRADDVGSGDCQDRLADPYGKEFLSCFCLTVLCREVGVRRLNDAVPSYDRTD